MLLHVREVTGDSVLAIRTHYSAEDIARWFLLSSLQEARHAEQMLVLAYAAAGMYDKKFRVQDVLEEADKVRQHHVKTLDWIK